MCLGVERKEEGCMVFGDIKSVFLIMLLPSAMISLPKQPLCFDTQKEI